MWFVWKLVKALLRSVFSIIVFLLLVGLARMKRDINAYISFLNTRDWSVFRRSQVSTWVDPFRPSQQSSSLEDVLSSDETNTETSDFDVYDPEFEKEFSTLIDESGTGEDENFGFVTGEQTSSNTFTDTIPKDQLLKLIQKRELAQ